jgi:hypothetical protein
MKTTKADYETISKIANRAIDSKLNLHEDKLNLMMDIEYCNDSTPLDLDGLLVANDFDFSHDILGIQNNFNRITKTLNNCFLPRYAK